MEKCTFSDTIIGYESLLQGLDCKPDKEYHYLAKNMNCQAGKIVNSIEECQDASASLGFMYLRNRTFTNSPAGCHRQRFGSDQYVGQFNNIINPNLTNPDQFSNNVRAICRCRGRFI